MCLIIYSLGLLQEGIVFMEKKGGLISKITTEGGNIKLYLFADDMT